MIWYVIVAFRMFLDCVSAFVYVYVLTHPWLITFILYSNMCLVFIGLLHLICVPPLSRTLEILRVPAILRLEILRVPAILRLEICRCQRFSGWKSAGASDFEAGNPHGASVTSYHTGYFLPDI